MLVAPGPESVAEPKELRLIDRRQDRHHRCLDDLVLQACDAERSLSAICLRYISPPRWPRPIRSREETPMECREFGLKALRIVRPRPLIDAGRRELIQVKEARPQDIDTEVM